MTNYNTKRPAFDGTQLTAFAVTYQKSVNQSAVGEVAIQHDIDQTEQGGILKVVVRHQEILDHLNWEEQETLADNIKFTALMVAQRRLADLTLNSKYNDVYYLDTMQLDHDTHADSCIEEKSDLDYTSSAYCGNGNGSTQEVLLVNYEPRSVTQNEDYALNYSSKDKQAARQAGIVHENVAQVIMEKGYSHIPAGIGWNELVQQHPAYLGNTQLNRDQVEIRSILPLGDND